MVSIPVAPSPRDPRPLPRPLRWTALHYRLPADDSPTRAQLWRALRRRNALNLRHGLWAVPHRPGAGAGLDGVVADLRAAGATARAEPVAADDTARQEQLARACDRLWVGFGHAADRLVSVLEDGTPATERLARGLPGLHAAFRANRARDLALSPAGERAARRLDDLEWMVANLGGHGPGPRRPDGSAAIPDLRLASTVQLDDGTVRAVAQLDPAPDVGWERAFAAFERAVYRATLGAEIRHGTVVVAGEPDDVAGRLDAVLTRIGRFTSSLR